MHYDQDCVIASGIYLVVHSDQFRWDVFVRHKEKHRRLLLCRKKFTH